MQPTDNLGVNTMKTLAILERITDIIAERGYRITSRAGVKRWWARYQAGAVVGASSPRELRDALAGALRIPRAFRRVTRKSA